MKLAFFIVFSASLHGAALVLPISYPALNGESSVRAILVTLDEAGGGPGHDGEVEKEIRSSTPPAAAKQSAAVPKVTERTDPISLPAATPFAQDSATVNEGLEVVKATDSLSSVPTVRIFGAAGGSAAGGTGQSDRGSGMGSGRGLAPSGGEYARASYRETPKPQYPETARRDGKEGRVLLRVLVNKEGRSVAVEVNRSSGDEALDQAAVTAIKRWRFAPARNGGQPVESWVRVPVDFRLTDTQD